MIKIKAREKNGILTYKNRHKREAEIEQIASGENKGKYGVYYAFSRCSCAMTIKDDKESAKSWVENVLKNCYSFLVGEGIEFEYV